MLYSGGLATLSPLGSIGGSGSSGGCGNTAFGSTPNGSSSNISPVYWAVYSATLLTCGSLPRRERASSWVS